MTDLEIIACPNCKTEVEISFSALSQAPGDTMRHVCKNCRENFLLRAGTVVRKTSEGNADARTRTFDILVKDSKGAEESIRIHSEILADFELRADDAVIFVSDANGISRIYNLSAASHYETRRPRRFAKWQLKLALFALAIAVAIIIHVRRRYAD